MVLITLHGKESLMKKRNLAFRTLEDIYDGVVVRKSGIYSAKAIINYAMDTRGRPDSWPVDAPKKLCKVSGDLQRDLRVLALGSLLGKARDIKETVDKSNNEVEEILATMKLIREELKESDEKEK